MVACRRSLPGRLDLASMISSRSEVSGQRSPPPFLPDVLDEVCFGLRLLGIPALQVTSRPRPRCHTGGVIRAYLGDQGAPSGASSDFSRVSSASTRTSVLAPTLTTGSRPSLMNSY